MADVRRVNSASLRPRNGGAPSECVPKSSTAEHGDKDDADEKPRRPSFPPRDEAGGFVLPAGWGSWGGVSFGIENFTRALRPRRGFLRGVVTKLGNLGRSNQMDFAKAVFDVEFSTARQQPGVVVMVNTHLRPIRDMHREGAEQLCAEALWLCSSRVPRGFGVRLLARPPTSTVPLRLLGALALSGRARLRLPAPRHLRPPSQSGGAPPHYKTLSRGSGSCPSPGSFSSS